LWIPLEKKFATLGSIGCCHPLGHALYEKIVRWVLILRLALKTLVTACNLNLCILLLKW